MSQAGELNVVQNHPTIPTSFSTNSGTAIPLANDLEIYGTGSITTSGAGNIVTVSLTGLTNHNVLVGAGTATITNVPPSAISGVPLISQGSLLDPIFGTAVVAGGGTGDTSFTAYAPICGGTTSTNPLQSATTGFSTIGTVLTSNGSGALPSWQPPSSLGEITQITVDTTSGTGTNPVLPTLGNVTMTGGQYATGTRGTRVVDIESTSASTISVLSQQSTAVASTNSAKNGISHFDSASFAVDANGFVMASTTGILKTLTGNSGGAISPTAGNINTLGTGSITISGAGSTLTTQLTGLTNHAIQVGAGTATLTQLGAGSTGQVLQTNTGADPTWSTATFPSTATGTGTILRANGTNWVATTATYPATTTINQILYSSANDVIGGLTTANQGMLTTGTTGIPVITTIAANGQIIIGSTAGAPAAATLTPGAGISITNGSNSITIAATGAGVTWTDVIGATQTIVVENGYLTDRGGGVTYTLPATASIGDAFMIVGKLGITTITPNANQQLLIGSASGSVGATGTAVGTNVGDCIEFICTTSGASTVWRAGNFVGNWTLS